MNIQEQFRMMLDKADQARQTKSDESLTVIFKAWPTMNQADRDWIYNRMRLAVAMTQANRGGHLLRAWRWVMDWWYQLPAVLRKVVIWLSRSSKQP